MNREDEIIRETLVTHGGEVVNARVNELLGNGCGDARRREEIGDGRIRI